MRLVRSVLMVAALALTVTTFALAEASFPRDVLSGIDAMRKLPAEGFHVVESKGRLLLVSTNGHYVVMGGRILDLWNQVEVRSVADVDRTTRIPLERMGLDSDDLGGVSLGQGPQVVLFLDPASHETPPLLRHVRTLADSYRFRLVFMPARAERRPTSQALICSKAAALRFIETGETAPEPTDAECGRERLQRNMVTASLLGVRRVPFTIAPNGATSAGVPADYAAFLKDNGNEPQ